MSMIEDLFILIVSAAVIVAAVRFLLISGIGRVGVTLKLSVKARGQMIGYATSIPEFTVLVAGAYSGVFAAGMWNIASSNIINLVLFLITVFAFRQQLDLKNKTFRDEILFGLLSILIPLLMFAADVAVGYVAITALFGFFIFYKVMDKRLNRAVRPAVLPPGAEGGTGWGGALMLIAGVVVILIAGRFLGDSAGTLIKQLNVPAWAVGWILGLVTSVCELASFIEIYRIHKLKDSPLDVSGTQEALDALVASNISNLGLILPLGMLVYLVLS